MKKLIEKIKNNKILGVIIGISIVLIIGLVIILTRGKNNKPVEITSIFPEGNEYVELELGTYFNEKQTDYCKIKLPGNYFGWAMYLDNDNSNKNFEMANSRFISDAVNNGLLEAEQAIQQFHYSNSQLVEENTTNIYANIFNSSQITYDGMKAQMSGAVDIKEIEGVAFYSKGDKKYTDIDVTMYYKLSDEITLEVSYKGPLAEEIGVDKIAHKLFELIEVIK